MCFLTQTLGGSYERNRTYNCMALKRAGWLHKTFNMMVFCLFACTQPYPPLISGCINDAQQNTCRGVNDSMRHCFKLLCVFHTLPCITPQTSLSTGLRFLRLLGGHRSAEINSGTYNCSGSTVGSRVHIRHLVAAF